MARLFNPLLTLREMSSELLQRSRDAALGPQVLGLEVFNHDHDLRRATHDDARTYRITVGRSKVRLKPGNLGRNYPALRRRDLTPLLLGHWKLDDAIESGHVRASTQRARRAGEALFP